ncbi:hypothetical protein CDEST_09718 [Colletotrichum destructivum]|uniref:Uncharacterized protein n=1 Tax=Colletotrichum destructivum TaxID=34406 RepID=A0AAX4IMW8_9PEZI|nr:hypothetical protein CDEST_09718 [Colletotrichum destructivum]
MRSGSANLTSSLNPDPDPLSRFLTIGHPTMRISVAMCSSPALPSQHIQISPASAPPARRDPPRCRVLLAEHLNPLQGTLKGPQLTQREVDDATALAHAPRASQYGLGAEQDPADRVQHPFLPGAEPVERRVRHHPRPPRAFAAICPGPLAAMVLEDDLPAPELGGEVAPPDKVLVAAAPAESLEVIVEGLQGGEVHSRGHSPGANVCGQGCRPRLQGRGVMVGLEEGGLGDVGAHARHPGEGGCGCYWDGLVMR